MTCSICLSKSRDDDKLKHLSLYVHGSEGIMICFDCEIMLVEHIRKISSIAGRALLTANKVKKCGG